MNMYEYTYILYVYTYIYMYIYIHIYLEVETYAKADFAYVCCQICDCYDQISLPIFSLFLI